MHYQFSCPLHFCRPQGVCYLSDENQYMWDAISTCWTCVYEPIKKHSCMLPFAWLESQSLVVWSFLTWLMEDWIFPGEKKSFINEGYWGTMCLRGRLKRIQQWIIEVMNLRAAWIYTWFFREINVILQNNLHLINWWSYLVFAERKKYSCIF